MNPSAANPARLALLASACALLCTGLAGCSTIDNFIGGDKADYRSTAAKSQPLEVPPDLTQLARESRYQPQGGAISASSVGVAQPGAAVASTAAAVALNAFGDARIERQGQQRWLATSVAPEQLWPAVRAFWEARGLKLAQENAATGVMETEWAENRAKLSNDLIRNTIGKFFSGLYDSGLRDQFRTRIERTSSGSEVTIAHRGMEEVYSGERKESTTWRARPSDPQLEAEMLSSLMLSLGSKTDQARLQGAGGAMNATAAAPAASAPASRAAAVAAAANQATTLVIDEPYDRAWRRVGLALDRGGFTVEDRDRAGGLYYVRTIDPKNIGKEEPNWFTKLFSRGEDTGALRYRIALKAAGDKTQLSVQTSAGAPDTGDNAKRIVGLLMNDLR